MKPIHIAVAFLGLCLACEKQSPEPEPAPKKEPGQYTGPELPGARPKNPHAQNPHAGNPHAGSGPHPGMQSAGDRTVQIEWADPSDWKKATPTSPMRKASYVIPKAAGDPEDGELHLFYFGKKFGGDVDANVKRWLGQFPETKPEQAKRSEREVRGMKQTLVEIEDGLFMSGPPMGKKVPKKGFGLLGAIVAAPTGNYFFKMTGPSKTVKAARPKFIELLDSIKPKT